MPARRVLTGMSDDVTGAGEPDGGPAATGDADDVEPSADDRLRALAETVADHDEALAEEAETLAADVAALRERADRADDLESRLKRKQAEFENYKKRQERERERLKERATAALVERVVEVRDDLVRALAQDEDADLRDGLAGTLATFDEVLAEEGVDPVEPDPGDEVDPARHEVLMREAGDHPEGTVVRCYRPGYEMADQVIQTAQVTVSDGPEEDEASEADTADGESAVE
jgi:molecular chaperone GrpE